jgi:GNAT superfamily N-acetyltransferase
MSRRRLLPEEAHAFANVDYHRRMAVVAEVDHGKEPELVGVARYGPSDEGTADIGLVVADGWQGLGLGSLLLEEILRAGEQRGIRAFSAAVLTDNRRALHLLARHTAIARRTVAGGVTSVVFGRRSGLRSRKHDTRRLLAYDSPSSDRGGIGGYYGAHDLLRREPVRARLEIAKHFEGDPVIKPLPGRRRERRGEISGRVNANSFLAIN